MTPFPTMKLSSTLTTLEGGIKMKVELITKRDFQERIYVKDEKLREVFTSLTKKKTLDILDLENFKKIGIEFSLVTDENPLKKFLIEEII